MKALTFVIPAYNSEKFLDKCISSMVLPELLDKIEIIVVNDGSTDATVMLAEKYCAMYPNTVRLLSQENKGHGGALNTGCRAAQGKYLKIVDADDWVVTENLSKFVNRLEGCNADVVLTHYHTIDISTGEKKSWRSYPTEFGKVYTWNEIIDYWKDFDRCLTFHGIAYRTEFYQERKTSLSEHVFYEDHEYATFPCCYAASVVPLDLFIYEYRIGDIAQSVSQENQVKRIRHMELVLKNMMAKYNSLSNIAESQRVYAERKIQGLLLSYMKIALLIHPEKRTGRLMAQRMMDICKAETPDIYDLTKKKYRIFYWLNRFHVNEATWKRILDSGIYNFVMRRHTFE